jgi:hypothetical protein
MLFCALCWLWLRVNLLLPHLKIVHYYHMNEENIRAIYVRALENLADRIDSIKSNSNNDIFRLNHFIRRDLIKYEAEISRIIQEWREENYPPISNRDLLYTALELYKKDLQETGETVKKRLGLDGIEFPLVENEIQFIEMGMEKLSV